MDLYLRFSEALADFEKNGFDLAWFDNNYPHYRIAEMLYAIGHQMGSVETTRGPLPDSTAEIAIGCLRAGYLDGVSMRQHILKEVEKEAIA